MPSRHFGSSTQRGKSQQHFVNVRLLGEINGGIGRAIHQTLRYRAC